MKKYGFLVPIVLIVLMVLSCYTLLTKATETTDEYDGYISEARRYADLGVTKYAVYNYRRAINSRNSEDIYVEVAEYYKNSGTVTELIEWSNEYMLAWPKSVTPYEYLAEAYKNDEDYNNCFKIINQAEKRKLHSDLLDEISNALSYEYKYAFGAYDNVGVFCNGYCAVESDERWGYIDSKGNNVIGIRFDDAEAFTNSGIAAVSRNDEEYFIDNTGAKVLATKEQYRSFGLMASNLVAAEKNDGKYVYLDQDLTPVFGDYDYATTFNYGIAAVRIADEWSLITTDGQPINGDTYKDIIVDEKYIACRNDRVFVSVESGLYVMIDSNGNRVGNLEFEDAIPFNDESYAAVKIAGKWQFINAQGDIVSEQKYDMARSYYNGLAAVCVDELWGFIDANGEMVIEPQFYDAKDFTDQGSCFVKEQDSWSLIRLYKLNWER